VSARIPCQCGNLIKWAQDPGIPYRYDRSTGTYSLDLSQSVSVTDAVCVFCGGHPSRKGVPFCKCGFLKKCEQDPSLPIEVAEIGNSYQLRCVVQGEDAALYIWFCPACGGSA
jgi:hypothetical protein